jgi:DNA-binding GntR family transcriptional regulator
VARTTGYSEIAEHYRDQIRRGEIRPGDQLPAIRTVAETWGVSKTTATRAYHVLKMHGLTIGGSGPQGTVVAQPASENIAARVSSYMATGKALLTGEISRILEIGTVGADEIVARRLDVVPGTPVHVRRRLVSRDGVPLHVSSSYYPAFVIQAAPELTKPISTGGSRELAAERLGSAQDRVLEEVTARLATQWEKRVLGLTRSAIVTQVIRTVSLADDRVVEVAVKVCSGSTVLRWSTKLG